MTEKQNIRVHLIGTGGPELTPKRLGISALIDANGQKLLFDVGRGALQNIYLSRIDPRDVTKIFLTHMHNDHIEGLPSMWITPWFLLRRTKKLEVWGPEGTKQMVEGMRLMYEHDLNHRVSELLKREYLDINVLEIQPGLVYDNAGIKVTAFPVEHGDGNPAFGYRIDASGRSVVMSGDTTFNENVVKFGTGADLLISNVVAFSERMMNAGLARPVLDKLTTAEQGAEIFTKAKPRLALYTHIVKAELPPGEQGDAIIIKRTREAGYIGPLAIGHDRMIIDIGDEIKVLLPPSIDDIPEFYNHTSKF